MAEFIIHQCLGTHRNLDMRLLVNALADRLQWQAGDSRAHWQDLVLSRLRERAVPARESRDQRKLWEREVARRIRDLPREERLGRWQAETGKSQAALYRRLAEVEG